MPTQTKTPKAPKKGKIQTRKVGKDGTKSQTKSKKSTKKEEGKGCVVGWEEYERKGFNLG